MMWCPVCNIDMPSCLCKLTYGYNSSLPKLKGKELVELQTRVFLHCINVMRHDNNGK